MCRPKEMQSAIESLVENPQKQTEMGKAGLALCMASQGATQKSLAIIAAFI
jgi:3-deoxy-D-manno-octulosonic-acid transferase